jgi:hypothetical protein
MSENPYTDAAYEAKRKNAAAEDAKAQIELAKIRQTTILIIAAIIAVVGAAGFLAIAAPEACATLPFLIIGGIFVLLLIRA